MRVVWDDRKGLIVDVQDCVVRSISDLDLATTRVGIVRCCIRYYTVVMVTMTLKLPPALSTALEAEATQRATSKSSVVRAYIEEGLRKGRARRTRPSCLDLVGDLAGSFEGPADLSTNTDYLDEAIDNVARCD